MYLKQFRTGFQKSASSQTPVIYKGLKNKARNYKVYGNSTQATSVNGANALDLTKCSLFLNTINNYTINKMTANELKFTISGNNLQWVVARYKLNLKENGNYFWGAQPGDENVGVNNDQYGRIYGFMGLIRFDKGTTNNPQVYENILYGTTKNMSYKTIPNVNVDLYDYYISFFPTAASITNTEITFHYTNLQVSKISKLTNLFDGQIELGTINATTGVLEPATITRRSKNYINVNNSTQYCIEVGTVTGGAIGLRWYDVNYNYIGSSPTFGTTNPIIITSPSNAKYLKFIDTTNQANNTFLINELSYNQFVPNSPTPEYQSEIKSVGDKTANLFNKATAVPGYIRSTDGLLTASVAGNYSTDYILVNQPSYTISGHNYVQSVGQTSLAWYTENKTFISSNTFSGITGNGTYTKPANAVYCRYTVYPTDLNTSQFEAGTSATAYVPFGYKIDVVSRGKNLFNLKTTYTTQTLNGVTIKNNHNGTITINGHTNNAFGFDLTDFLYFNPLKNYKISINKISGTLTNYVSYVTWAILLQEHYESGTPTFQTNYSLGQNSISSSVTFVKKNTIRKKYKLWFGKDSNTTQYDANFNDLILSFQIEENSTETQFEPYTPPSTTTYYLNEPLRAIEVPSTANYNVVANSKYYISDYIDKANSKVVRRVGTTAVDGTNLAFTVLTTDTTGYNRFRATSNLLASDTTVNTNKSMCNYATLIANGATFNRTNGFVSSGTSILLYNSDFATYTAEQINAWAKGLTAAGTPFTVVGLLPTPTEENITTQNLEIKEETTIIESNNEVQPLLYTIDYNSKSNKN